MELENIKWENSDQKDNYHMFFLICWRLQKWLQQKSRLSIRMQNVDYLMIVGGRIEQSGLKWKKNETEKPEYLYIFH